MAFSVKDPATDEAVRRLADITGKGITETIREAVENEYRRRRKEIPLEERLKSLFDELEKYPPTGLEADKAFFDELSGDT